MIIQYFGLMEDIVNIELIIIFVDDNIFYNFIPAGRLCTEDIENLRAWTPQPVKSVAEELAPQGYKDLYNMAKRFQTRFPTLLNQSYDADEFKVSVLIISLYNDDDNNNNNNNNNNNKVK